MPTTFDAERAHLIRRFTELGCQQELAMAIADELAKWAIETAPQPNELGSDTDDVTLHEAGGEITSRFTRWVIRDEDIKQVAAICGALQAVTAPEFFVHLNPHDPQFWHAVASTALSSFTFAYQVRKMAAHLTPPQHRVLMALKARGPAT